jgi:hypothetical protein
VDRRNSAFEEVIIDGWPHIYVVTTRVVEECEELLVDYGPEWWTNFQVHCNLSFVHDSLFNQSFVHVSFFFFLRFTGRKLSGTLRSNHYHYVTFRSDNPPLFLPFSSFLNYSITHSSFRFLNYQEIYERSEDLRSVRAGYEDRIVKLEAGNETLQEEVSALEEENVTQNEEILELKRKLRALEHSGKVQLGSRHRK